MISGATEEELIVANARAEVLTKCGKDILDILDNQNEKYEKQLEHEVKYQNNEVVRLNNIIDELEEDLEKNYIRWKKYAKTHKEDAWRMIICKYYLDKLKELKDK